MDKMLPVIAAYCQKTAFMEAAGLRSTQRITFLAQGEYNVNWLVEGESMHDFSCRRVVFRLNTASQLQLENQIAYEYRALEALAPSGITPEPLYLDDSKTELPYGMLCMAYLSGRPLNYGSDISHAARLLGILHSCDIKAFEGRLIEEKGLCRTRVNEGRRWLNDYRLCSKRSDKTFKALENLADWCERMAPQSDAYFEKAPWRMVNNTELNSHNFIIGPDRQFIIDWEKPVISDPVQDITQFLAPTTTLWRDNYILSEEEIRQFYRVYETVCPKPVEEVKHRVSIYRPYLHLRALSWCAHAYSLYCGGDRVINNPDTFRKICDYLEPEFIEKFCTPDRVISSSDIM